MISNPPGLAQGYNTLSYSGHDLSYSDNDHSPLRRRRRSLTQNIYDDLSLSSLNYSNEYKWQKLNNHMNIYYLLNCYIISLKRTPFSCKSRNVFY